VIKEVEIDLGILGEQWVEVDFNYYPEESATSLEPGSPAEYEFDSITLNGVELFYLFDDESLKKLEAILDKERTA